MPILGSRGAGSASAFGLTAGVGVPYDVDFLVIAGGGAGGYGDFNVTGEYGGGGAGAGGYRNSYSTELLVEEGQVKQH
jgi:hypothetical protein